MAAAPECSNIQAWWSLMVTQRCEVWQNASQYNCFYTNFHIAAAADVLAIVILHAKKEDGTNSQASTHIYIYSHATGSHTLRLYVDPCFWLHVF